MVFAAEPIDRSPLRQQLRDFPSLARTAPCTGRMKEIQFYCVLMAKQSAVAVRSFSFRQKPRAAANVERGPAWRK